MLIKNLTLFTFISCLITRGKILEKYLKEALKNMPKQLFDSDSENETNDLQLKTNLTYAKIYNDFRQKEELNKRKGL